MRTTRIEVDRLSAAKLSCLVRISNQLSIRSSVIICTGIRAENVQLHLQKLHKRHDLGV
jgi:hypothetical protein